MLQALGDLRKLSRAPLVQKLLGQLQACIGPARGRSQSGTPVPPPGGSSEERLLQAALLAFKRDLLGVASQRGAPPEGGGPPKTWRQESSEPNALFRGRQEGCEVQGAAMAREMAIVDELSQDILRACADLQMQPQLAKRVLMCRADAFVRVCQTGPTTPSSLFLSEALQCRCVREFLVTPAASAQAYHGTA
jgi:hypothetical protein